MKPDELEKAIESVTTDDIMDVVEGIAKREEDSYFLRFLGDPVLEEPGKKIETLEDIPPGLVEAMFATCRKENGRGLAAHQLGIPIRLAILSDGNFSFVAINPSVHIVSPDKVKVQEGCLSMPGFWTTMSRFKTVEVLYQDVHLASRKKLLTGVDAQCAQHEIDHLDGILITRFLPRQAKRQAERMVATFLRKRQ